MLVPHDYWIFENAELNSAFKSLFMPATGIELLFISQSHKERSFAATPFLNLSANLNSGL